MIVYGSTAMKIGLEKIGRGLGRTPADLDILATQAEARLFIQIAELTTVQSTPDKFIGKAPDGRMVEIEKIKLGTSSHLYQMYAESMSKLDTQKFYGFTMDIAPLAMLYSMKRAHRHSPRMFEKHVGDYRLLQGLFTEDIFSKITKMRYDETVAREKLRTPSLNKGAKDFFDDKVSNRTFIHDQIHEVMAFGPRPMFEQIKIDADKVACSREKFEGLTFMNRIRCVQEEAYVIALERAMIPMLFEGEKIAKAFEAYKWAVMRICTTLCSGWFREFALDNYHTVMSYYDPNYVETFLKAVESGRIERIQND
jgi:hypothetical protein